MSRVAVIGGGPSGMLAAAMAARGGHEVLLFERNEKLGKKLYITGKGRANFTNTADNDSFFANIVHNPKFLFSAYRFFPNTEIMKLIENNGTPVKVERGGRVFPASDKSSDVIRALIRNLDGSGVIVKLNSHIEQITAENNVVTGVIVNREQLRFDAVILCTGGLSYPATGSTGDGLAFAKELGHRIITPHGALVPIETLETWPYELSGLSLKNVRLTLFLRDKEVYSEQGEMLLTHFGVSGPLVLSASSHLTPDVPAYLDIDLKPALTYEQLDKRILRDFKEASKKQFRNALGDLLPHSIIPNIVRLSDISGDRTVGEFTKAERSTLVKTLKAIRLTVKRTRPIEEAIITCGGVSTKDVNPSTMESKLVKGLYIAGELLDVDAYTGGFNLQIAFSTGALAGASV